MVAGSRIPRQPPAGHADGTQRAASPRGRLSWHLPALRQSDKRETS
jgi:hypothetical protein